ncbi:unnamed protein product, partial [Closterium sp. NIES-64]
MEDFVFDPSSIPAEIKLSGDPYSSGEHGKMAFLFLTRSTIPLAPLWERFFKACSLHPLSTPANPHPPIHPFWSCGADITMVDAERRLVEISLLDPDNLFFTLVSERCGWKEWRGVWGGVQVWGTMCVRGCGGLGSGVK